MFVLVITASGVLLGSYGDAMAAGAGEACNPTEKDQCNSIPPEGFYTCMQKDNSSDTKEFSCQCRWGNLESGWWGWPGSDDPVSVCDLYLAKVVDSEDTPLPTNNPRGAILLLFAMFDGVAAWIIALTVMAAMVMIVTGGYLYMTAGGNADRVRKAKMWIGSSLAGIFLAIMAYTILRLIAKNLVDFS